jgi:hypothetical protein
MKNLIKSVKENTAAIITALVIFIFISNYFLNIIPGNEVKTDNYNQLRLEAFSEQVQSTLYDYANKVDNKEIQEHLKCGANAKQCNVGDFISEYRIDTLIILGLTNKKERFKIKRRVACTPHIIDPIDTITDFSKQDFIKRLNGATSLPYWVIYIIGDENSDRLNSNSFFLSHNIENQELDSLYKKLDIASHDVVKNKRYYKTILKLKGSEFKLGIIGAVDLNEYNAEVRKFNPSSTIISVALIILLLLLIPLIKPLVSSTKEKFTQLDVINATIAVCICTILIAVCTFTYYFSHTSSEKIKTNLAVYNKNLKYSILSEFNSHKAGRDTIIRSFKTKYKPPHTDILSLVNDSIINKNKDVSLLLKNASYANTNSSEKTSRLDVQCNVIKFFSGNNIKMPEIIFEMDTNANMNWDITEQEKYSIRKNYRDRDYYKKWKEGKQKVISAVYSKYDNEFKMVYFEDAFPGTNKLNRLTGFVYEPQFEIPDMESPDYGYLLCDETGRVLLHSNPQKRLNENIFNVSHNTDELIRFFHGYDIPPYIDLDYNEEDHTFYGSRLFSDSADIISKSAPLYLFTYKNLKFENELRTYSITKAFIISVAFAIGTGLLLLLYSAFLYYGHLSVFSKTHVYWMFPDKSKTTEFKWLIKLNYFGCGLIILFLIYLPDHAFFLTLITGINFAFINFIVLTQRAFIIDSPSYKRKKYFNYFILLMLCACISSWLLYHFGYSNMAIATSVSAHLIFLRLLKNITKTKLALAQMDTPISKKTRYNSFLGSIICLHYILIPALIVFSIFSVEKARFYDINISQKAEKNGSYEQKKEKAINYHEEFIFNSLNIIQSPTKKILEQSSFHNYQYDKSMENILVELFYTHNIMKAIYLLAGLISLVLLIILISDFYSSRFFFFELGAISGENYSKKNALTNFSFVIPPFGAYDLKKLEHNEIGKDNVPDEYIFPSKLKDDYTTPHKKMEMILNKALSVHKNDYIKIWNSITDDEKFVLHDFAVDYFVNYKNKKHLISLIEKGLIIADPYTGRLRIMNYSFRNFVIYYEKVDENFSVEDEANKIKGNFAKWKLPVMIIASSLIVLVTYLYKEKSDQIVLYGGSLISAIGLIVRFLNIYKK